MITRWIVITESVEETNWLLQKIITYELRNVKMKTSKIPLNKLTKSLYMHIQTSMINVLRH